MAPWFHTVVLATTFVATVAVGVAGASFFFIDDVAAPKGDRLPIAVDSSSRYATVETRVDNTSILNRVIVD
jgi:hypothetical protein